MNTDAGLGDPYWYEWTVGQSYILDLLDPDSHVVGVTLQATGAKGLDDVVVVFDDGGRRLIQVKHSRVADPLTFGDLVAGDDASSLVATLAAAWQDAERAGPCSPWVLTNRTSGAMGTSRGAPRVTRPALAPFLGWLSSAAATAPSVETMDVPAAWADAWRLEWLPQLEQLAPQERLTFLRRLRIETGERSLVAWGAQLRARIQVMLGVSSAASERLMARLDAALRLWATSARGARQQVVREDVYDALCLVEDAPTGEHELAPATPFLPSRESTVTDLAEILRARRTPVVFLCGEPGAGKTTVLSALANDRRPEIGARFHAYRPIAPDNPLLPADAGATTTSRALWTDLLLQIRRLLTGRLAQHRVPIHAGSLTVDEIRSHVLRLAEATALEEDRPFIIAIDGIDHAARAGSPNTFLASLVPPEEVPARVVMLIGGQPPDGYSAYPIWLRDPSPAVTRVELPRVGLADVEALVRSRSPDLAENEVAPLARDIWDESSGHMLSAVFAVEASRSRDGMPPPDARMRPRRLDRGITGYYERLWSAATHGFPTGAPARLAACLCLLPVRASPGSVVAVLGPTVSLVQAADFLRELHPLVVEESGGFRVFQNDVRVFLQGLLNAAPHVLRDCAHQLAEFLLVSPDPLARQAAAQDLFGKAGRPRDQAALFTPAYVLEGAMCGRPLGVLTTQAIVAAEAFAQGPPNWDLAHSVATGVRTLEQLRASHDFMEKHGAAARILQPAGAGGRATRAVERRVERVAAWTHDVVASACNDIEELLDAGELVRATAAFRRWFAEMSPREVDAACGARTATDAGAHHEIGGRAGVIERLGQLSGQCGELLACPVDETEPISEALYGRGMLASLDGGTSARKVARVLRRVTRAWPSDLADAIERFMRARNWRACAVALARWRPEEGGDYALALVGAAACALLRLSPLTKRWVEPLLLRPAVLREAVAAAGADIGIHAHAIRHVAHAAFLLGVQSPQRDASAVREELELYVRANRRPSEMDAAVSQVLHAAALLGSLSRTSSGHLPAAIHVDAQTLRRTLAVLFATGRSEVPMTVPVGFHEVTREIVSGIAECALEYAALATASAEAMLAEAEERLCGPHVETIWRVLDDAGHRPVLLAVTDEWVGPHGRLWSLPLQERYDHAPRLVELLGSIGEHERAGFVRDALARRSIGHRNHKEHVLRQPLEWFQGLARREPVAWRAEGTRLLALSRQASQSGDNRYARHVEREIVAAAATESPGGFAQLVGGGGSIPIADAVVVEGLIEMLERRTLGQDSLLSIWAFAIGQLAWQRREDRYLLARMRDEILGNGRRGGVGDLTSELAASASEFACERDPDDDYRVDPGPPSADATHVAKAMAAACAAPNWAEVLAQLRRIDRDHPAGSQGALEAVIAALVERPGAMPWFWQGVGDVYDVLVPLIPDSDRWKLVCHAAMCGADAAPEQRTRAIAENLDDLCRLRAENRDAGSLRAGLGRLLAMHELWGEVSAAAPLGVDADTPRWSEALIPLLFQLLEYDEQLYTQAALRGLHSILSREPSLCSRAVACARDASAAVERRFLFIAPPLAALPAATAVRDWLAARVGSPRLDVGLAAWSALRSAERELALTAPSLHFVAPAWPCRVHTRRRVRLEAAPLFQPPPRRTGLLTSAGDATGRVLEDLGQALGVPAGDLAAEFAAHARGEALEPRAPLYRTGHARDLVADRRGEALQELLFRQLGESEREGRFANVPIQRLAQALVPWADPHIFLRTPVPAHGVQNWPDDDALERLIGLGPTALEHALAGLAEPGKGQCLLAAKLRMFSAGWDIEIAIDHVVPLGPGSTLDGRSAILNGRAALAFEDAASLVADAGARDEEWLTCQVVGLHPFTDAHLDSFPGLRWRRLGWEPDPRDPLRWLRASRPVVWFERLAGPPRRVLPRDFLHRQPTLQRWVCVEDEWLRMAATWGQPRRRVRVACADAAG